VIRTKLIPALTGKPPPDDDMRNLLALPARLGGIALPNPTCQADVELSSSLKVTEPLKKAILKRSFEYAGDVVDDQMKAKDDVCKNKRELGKQAADSVKQELSGSLRRAMDLAQERGASTWLHNPAHSRIWLHTTQECLPRCPGSSLQLANSSCLPYLCLWYKILGRTCSIMSQRWISLHSTQ